MKIDISLLENSISSEVKSTIDQLKGDLNPIITPSEAISKLGIISALVISLYENAKEQNFTDEELDRIWNMKKESDDNLENLYGNIDTQNIDDFLTKPNIEEFLMNQRSKKIDNIVIQKMSDILMQKYELIELINKNSLSEEEILRVKKYYIHNYMNDWFGCTGFESAGFSYEYRFNYRKENEEVYKFYSDYQLMQN